MSSSDIKKFLIYVCIFMGAIYTNMCALGASNIETVIVFRAATPLFVCLLEYCFLPKQSLPSLPTIISLIMILMGAYIYVSADQVFLEQGIESYGWVLIYFFVISVEMTYGKI
eukprot:UN06309